MIDDGSTDRTYQIACEYAGFDDRIRVQRNEVRRGTAVARNLAIEAAQGRCTSSWAGTLLSM